MPSNNGDEAVALLDDENEDRSNKRQKVLSKVCETCRLKKSKCDNARPQCSTCHRKGVTCVYREKGQPGLRPGYGKAMESRMDRLEASVEEIDTAVQSFMNGITRSEPTHDDTLVQNPQSHDNQTTSDERHQPEILADDLMNAPGLWQTPPPMPMDEALIDISASLGEPQTSPFTSTATCGDLPPKEILDELIDLFFDRIYPWCPLFHKATFLEKVYDRSRLLLLHGIVAVAFRFWDGNSIGHGEKERYACQSREYVLLNTVDTCTLISTQALALLAVDALGQGTGPRAWNAMSLLATAARHLGIATNPGLSNAVTEANTPLVRNDEDDPGIFPSVVGAEERVRLFWVIVSLDRFSSVAHGVPGGILTRTIRMSYPKSDENWNTEMPEPLFNGAVRLHETKAVDSHSLWHQCADVMTLSDRCNQLLNQPVNTFELSQCQQWQNNFRQLDAAVSTWYISLPMLVRSRPSAFDPMWYLLHANIQLIKTRMYTVAGFPSTTSPHVRPSTSARSRCRQAARELSSLVSSLEPTHLDRLGPNFAFIMWVAARSLIILWTSGHETYENIKGDLETLLSSLRHLGKYWQSATRYCDLIQLVLDTKNSPGGQSHLDIFSDTRRTAYGLEKCLGDLADRRNVDIQPNPFDFLDMPFLDAGGLGDQWTDQFEPDGSSDMF